VIPWSYTAQRNNVYAASGLQPEPESAHVLVFSLIRHGESVLEVGCSRGYFAEKIKLEKECRVVGVEIDENAAEIARQRVGMTVFVPTADLPALPDEYLGGFDTILCADVIEHVTDPWSFVNAYKKYLTPTGRMIVSIPNVAHWTCRLMILRGNWEYNRFGLMDYTHLRFFTLESARRLLIESHLVPKKIISSWGPMDVYQRGPFAPTKHKGAHNLLVGLVKWLAKTYPTLFALQFVIEAEQENSL